MGLKGRIAWTTPDMLYQTCPFESQLVLWWDGPERHEDVGLNPVHCAKVELGRPCRRGQWYGGLNSFRRTPDLGGTVQRWISNPLRSCGLPQDRSVETIYVSGSENADDNPDPPPEAFECDQCGTSYRAPDVCTRRLNILCRDCRSQVVETDPNDPVPDWICTNPPDFCDVGEAPLCLFGKRFNCQDNQWRLIETCDDHCCEVGCSAE